MKSFLRKKTKIVATIGPATETQKQLEELFIAGVNVVRLNFSHNTHEWHLAVLERAKRAAKKQKKQIAILQDLAGPKIRTGKLENDEKVELIAGAKLVFTTKKVLGNANLISINYKKLPHEVKRGDVLKIEDGKKSVLVNKTTDTEIFCTVITGGFLGSNKGVNVPGVDLSISSLTAKDKRDIVFGIENKVDYIALSFVQNKNDILGLRRILDKGKSQAHIIAKIETEAAVRNIDEIIAVSDAIMVARGDMAIEIGAERVPQVQKMIIEKCNNIGKPVITATQMLDSMEESPVPTRAEVSDIANAILDGTDAIMLSGETTIGKFPILAVETMTSISARTEPENKNVDLEYFDDEMGTVDAITHSVVRIANNVRARLIVTLTEYGSTARMLARFKPHHGIVAITPHQKTANQLVLTNGCRAVVMDMKNDIKKITKSIQKMALKKNWVNNGDKIVITMGSKFGEEGSTNTIFVIEI
ncbi:MAG: pyruvate kinase [Candidatus Pacebacteria bacterium]|nr:pyruvate kinase [Candidatus Paceibacterota bacterium]